jgi:hypothetical protein
MQINVLLCLSSLAVRQFAGLHVNNYYTQECNQILILVFILEIFCPQGGRMAKLLFSLVAAMWILRWIRFGETFIWRATCRACPEYADSIFFPKTLVSTCESTWQRRTPE